MANIIKPKRSNTAAKVPNTTELTSGELGVNMADKKVYINNGTAIVQVGAGNLSGLGDVVITSPASGNALIYDATTTAWENANITAGSGVSVTNGAGSITIANTAPDQTVALTGAGATTISGTYPNFTISSVNTTYSLATSTVLGLIELGSDTQQTVASNAVTATASRSYALQVNASGQGVVNIPWTDTVYSLPAATTTVRGGIELGSDTAQIVAANTVSATASRTYALQVNAAGQGVVNVPWTDTNSGGTVTSVAVSGGTTGLTTSGGPITTSGTITLAGTLAVANGGTGATTAATARTNLGATTLGGNLYTLANVAAISFPRFNADNTVSSLDAATFRTAIGAGTGSGTVTSVASGTGLTGGPITTSGTLSLANTAVTAGSYTNASITVDAQGRLTAASSGASASGTVTSVSGTGTVSGLTLTGTVTTSGSLTLGGNLSIAADMIYNSFTATAAQTTFTTTNTYTSGKIEVFVNGVKLVNGTDVTVTSGTSVVMASGLPVNTRVDLVYPI